MKEITLWYRWINTKGYWEYITYTEGWNNQKEYKPKTPFTQPYRYSKEFAYMKGQQIIYAVN